jgi:hypothetical protein
MTYKLLKEVDLWLYYPNVKTTVKIREEIKQSTETFKALSNKYNLNSKTNPEMQARQKCLI